MDARRQSLHLALLSALLAASIAAGCSTSGPAPSSPAAAPANPTAQSAPTAAKAGAGRTLTDMAGVTVKLPAQVDRIADAWPAHHQVLTMLGYGDKIVASTSVINPTSNPWMYRINPALKNATLPFSNAPDVNTEELLKAKPTLAYMTTGDKKIEKLRELGLTVFQVNFLTFEDMKKCILVTGESLDPQASEKAKAFVSYLDSKIEMIRAVTSKKPMDQRPKVLHITDINPVKADGANTLIDQWIDFGGGVNAVKEFEGPMKEVNMEQVLRWNPDVIIYAGTLKESAVADAMKSPQWQSVKAVKENRVYRNPNGVFLWDRYGTEEALQIQWVAQTLYPDDFKSLDIRKETKYFFKTFMNYDLSDNDVELILKAQPPA